VTPVSACHTFPNRAEYHKKPSKNAAAPPMIGSKYCIIQRVWLENMKQDRENIDEYPK